MDESLSWQARLAKSNINILNIEFNDAHTVATVYYEFMYHPYHGSTKWCKTFTEVKGEDNQPIEGRDILSRLSNETLSLRKELEA